MKQIHIQGTKKKYKSQYELWVLYEHLERAIIEANLTIIIEALHKVLLHIKFLNDDRR
jgi:hypothetical protein